MMDLLSTNNILVGALAATVYMLCEMIKHLIHRKTRKPLDKVIKQIEQLHEWHSVRDLDGLPVWYVPRTMLQVEQDILKTLGIVVVNQEKLVRLLEIIREETKK